MRLVFMGTPDFAVSTLTALHRAGHEICLVLTQPDRPRGRHGEVQKSPVRLEAERLGLSVMTPQRLRKDEACLARLRALAPDVIVVTAYGQLLPQAVLDIPRYGCVNVHASLLPRYRGAAPIQWAIINGDAYSGVTTMQMDAGLDTGDMLMKRALPLAADETGGSLFEKLAALGGELIVETLQALEAGNLHPEPQNEAEASKVGMFTKESGRIDWQLGAVAIERRIRGLNPWPSAYTALEGRVLKLWAAKPVSPSSLPAGAVPWLSLGTQAEGQVQTLSDGRRLWAVTPGDMYLEITELQLEGKRRMPVADFLRGFAGAARRT